LGSHIQVITVNSFDHSLEISISEKPAFSISKDVAKNLYIKTI